MGLATGILPQELFTAPDDVIVTMADIFEARHRTAEAAKSKAGRGAPGRSARRKGL